MSKYKLVVPDLSLRFLNVIFMAYFFVACFVAYKYKATS